jgi:hypothetical protein
MCASRRASCSVSGSRPSRSAVIASATASNAASSSRRCSTTSSHQRSASAWPAVSASTPSGSVRTAPRSRRAPAAIHCATGRSMKRTGTSRASAWRSACHSGEKVANG